MKRDVPLAVIAIAVVILVALVTYGIYRASQPHLPAGAKYIQLTPEQAKKAKNGNM